jgi:DNA-binding PadR family transcriptional regulator
MSLKHALLGFLNYSSMTGYELKKFFDQSVHHFWNANLSQIYPTLSQMQDEGLLEAEVEYQEGRPNRKVYRITEAGRQELLRWLREPLDLPPTRMAFLIKVFFAGSMEKEEILDQLRQRLKMHMDRLAAYRDPVREVLVKNIEETGLGREGLFWGLTLEAGVRFEEAWVQWCREAIERIEAFGAIHPQNQEKALMDPELYSRMANAYWNTVIVKPAEGGTADSPAPDAGETLSPELQR